MAPGIDLWSSITCWIRAGVQAPVADEMLVDMTWLPHQVVERAGQGQATDSLCSSIYE